MKTVFIEIAVMDEKEGREWSSTKLIKYDPGDVNQKNFSRPDGINQVLYFAQVAFREVAEQVEKEAREGK